jgi:hypothetical protein
MDLRKESFAKDAKEKIRIALHLTLDMLLAMEKWKIAVQSSKCLSLLR